MAEPLAPRLPTRIPSLDGLRAVSILLVIFAHAASTHGAPAFFDRPMFTSLGNVGVRFFFIISGFLITALLLRDFDRYGNIRLKTFYGRRTLRILPAAFFYIATMWVLYLAGILDLRFHLESRTQASTAIPDLIHALTFTANYQHDYNWYYNHLWSLSVEEQFYILWPFVLFFFGVRRGLWSVAAVMILAPVVRLLMYRYGGGPEIALSREFQAVADALGTGCLTALLHNRLSHTVWAAHLRKPHTVVVAAALIALGYGAVYVARPLAYIVGQTLANVGIAILLQHLVRAPEGWAGRLMNTRLLSSIGVLSYSLYLWQQPFLNFHSTNWVSAFPQNIVFAVAAALASYTFVERPFLILKDRWQARDATLKKRAAG